MIRRVTLALILIVLVSCVPVLARNAMEGKWRTLAYTIHIPGQSGSFELVFESHKGERIVHPARWVKVGSEFTWTDKQNSPHIARLDPKNPDKICDVNSAYPNSPAYWYRIR